MPAIGSIVRYLAQRPDAAALGLVLAAAALIRLLFAFRAPPFYVGGDSPTYLEPAVELLQGVGFDPIVKRPPGYPLFLAAALWAFGLDLQSVTLSQHLVGIATAAAAFAIGRMTFGRSAGLLAGLLVAVNGPLLIFEHYVMAETLFTCLVAAGVAATLWATDDARSAERLAGSSAVGPGPNLVPRALVAGLLFGLASATRQTAQPLIFLVPLALLLARTNRNRVMHGSLAALAGFLLILLPWLTFDFVRHQTLSSATLGETLIWRLTRSGSDEFFRWSLPRVADAREHEMRKFVHGQAADQELPSDTKVALQRRFGLSEAEADRLMRTLAFEAIARHPGRYLESSLALLHEHLLGTQQWMGGQGKEGGVTRYVDSVSKYGAWWSERVRPLIQNASPGQEQEFRRAQTLVNFFQPYRFGGPLLALLVLGVAAALLSPRHRLGLVPAGGAMLLLTLAAFVAGDLPRYRYPADPLLAVLQMGGLTWAVGLAWRLLQQLVAGQRRLSPAVPRPPNA